jgi:hypothetical protein
VFGIMELLGGLPWSIVCEDNPQPAPFSIHPGLVLYLKDFSCMCVYVCVCVCVCVHNPAQISKLQSHPQNSFPLGLGVCTPASSTVGPWEEEPGGRPLQPVEVGISGLTCSEHGWGGTDLSWAISLSHRLLPRRWMRGSAEERPEHPPRYSTV